MQSQSHAADTPGTPPLPGSEINPYMESKRVFTCKVLVVDDEEEIVEEVVELLEDENFTCVGVSDARKALELIATDPDIAVVLSDIRMPHMSGLEMAAHIHSGVYDDRDISVIIMTGHAGMTEAIEALQIGAEDFLTKPISPEQLVHAVKRSAETVRLRQRDRSYAKDLAEEVQRKTQETVNLSLEVKQKNIELSKQNEELERSAKMKDEFLGMISHELNTPLNAILGFAYILESSMKEKGNDKDGESVRCIIDAGERIAKNVKSILCLADIQAGKLVANKQDVLVGDLIERVVSMGRKDADEQKARIETRLDKPELLVFVDPGLMSMGLAGILENAIKFSGPDSEIVISAKESGDAVEIAIADNGPGIPADTLTAALQPFQQGDGSLQRRFEGMGLGLPLARKLAILHGGTMDVVSDPGKGTSVVFVIPKASDLL